MPTGIYKHKPMSEEQKEKTSLVWYNKRGKVSYSGLHRWVQRRLGKPQKCDKCGLVGLPKGRKRYFEWANKSGKYLRKVSDWMRLCRPCHNSYDRKPRFCSLCERGHWAKGFCRRHWQVQYREKKF